MAVRIAGIIIPQDKRVQVSLTYIYGIGPKLAIKILNDLNIDLNKRTKDLTEAEVDKVRDLIRNQYKIEGDLKREVLSNIKRLKDINSYRGSRHAKRLPVRGQRTKTNSRTLRGNIRKTAVSGKKIAVKK